MLNISDKIDNFIDKREGFCDTRILNADIVIKLRIAELKLNEGNLTGLDNALDKLSYRTHQLLTCSPAQPYAWFIRAWLHSVKEGYDETALSLLEKSYITGPREGWFAVKRALFSYTIFEKLKPAYQKLAIDEFYGLAAAGFTEDAATIIRSIRPDMQKILLEKQREIPEMYKRDIEKKLRQKGIEKNILTHQELKPWE